jgi:hypothetical protein
MIYIVKYSVTINYAEFKGGDRLPALSTKKTSLSVGGKCIIRFPVVFNIAVAAASQGNETADGDDDENVWKVCGCHVGTNTIPGGQHYSIYILCPPSPRLSAALIKF